MTTVLILGASAGVVVLVLVWLNRAADSLYDDSIAAAVSYLVFNDIPARTARPSCVDRCGTGSRKRWLPSLGRSHRPMQAFCFCSSLPTARTTLVFELREHNFANGPRSS